VFDAFGFVVDLLLLAGVLLFHVDNLVFVVFNFSSQFLLLASLFAELLMRLFPLNLFLAGPFLQLSAT